MLWTNRRDRILVVFFCLAIFVSALNRFKESDSFYHLRTGQLIWETHQIPTADVYSFTAPGAAWVPHEWLAQVVTYGVYSLAGFWGLIILAALLATGVYLMLLYLAVRRGAELPIAVILFLILGYLTLELWIPRPQIFAFTLWALLLMCLELYRHSGRRKYLIGIGLIILAWANMHASVILGLLTVLWYALSAYTARRRANLWGGEWAPKIEGHLWFTVLGATLLSLCNPSTYRVLLYPFYIQMASQALQVLEWKPILDFWGTRREVGLFVTEILVSAVFLIWWYGLRKASRDLTLLGVVLGVTALPFISIRHAGFWPITVLLPLSLGISLGLKPWLVKFSLGERFSLALILCLTFFVVRGIASPSQYYNERTVPVQAADFMEREHVRGPLFNLYNEGGYLIWRLWPGEKVFIDGRSEVYGPEQVRDFLYLATGGTDSEKLLDKKYKINVVFLAQYPVPRLKESIRPLAEKLVKHGWQLVYWDDAAVIYVRPNSVNEGVSKQWAIRDVSPFVEPESFSVADAKRVRSELRELLQRFPDSFEVLEYARRFAVSHPLAEPEVKKPVN